MLRHIVRRLLLAIPTLLAVLTVIFIIVRVAPGDPATAALGDYASADAVQALRERMGLDEPLYVQYLTFLGDLARGDLGNSLITGTPISEQIAFVFPYTLELTLTAIVIGLLLGIPVGVVTAVRRNTAADYIGRIFSLIGLSLPAFYLGILLMYFLAVRIDLFPTVGAAEFSKPFENLHHLILPALSLGLIETAYIARMTRSVMINVLSDDYVRTARAKGLANPTVLYGHALRAGMIPVVSLVGIFAISLIGSSVLIEEVFARPGLGKLMVGATKQRDYTAFAVDHGHLRVDDRRHQPNHRSGLHARRSTGQVRLMARAARVGSPALPLEDAPRLTARQRAWRSFTSNRTAVIGLAMVMLLVVIAVAAPLLAPADPIQQNVRQRLEAPSAEAWLGRDDFGRDIFSRVIFGTQTALQVGIFSVLLGGVVGDAHRHRRRLFWGADRRDPDAGDGCPARLSRLDHRPPGPGGARTGAVQDDYRDRVDDHASLRPPLVRTDAVGQAAGVCRGGAGGRGPRRADFADPYPAERRRRADRAGEPLDRLRDPARGEPQLYRVGSAAADTDLGADDPRRHGPPDERALVRADARYRPPDRGARL